MDIQKLIEKRANLWANAKNYLDAHTDEDGKISAKDAATYEKMEGDIVALGKQIDRFQRRDSMENYLSGSDDKPLLSDLGGSADNKKGRASNEYRKEFFRQVRDGFKTAKNYLQVADPPTQGGYLVPTEFDNAIQSELENENVMRQIGRVIQTQSEHKICLVATKPTAAWVAEGQSINLSTEAFAQISLSAFKLVVGLSISNELLQDSYYDLEEHLAQEFGKAIARTEEQAFITGTGIGQPTGILYTISSDNNCYLTTTATGTISADDLITLQYSLPRPYRKNACWLMNDETVARIRKLKDSTQNFIWQPSLTDSEPPKLLGAPVYTSPYMPATSSANIPVLFGDFNYYTIGERGQRVFKPLRELHALSDLTDFLMIERVDAILTDKKAIKGLYVS